MIYIRVWGGLGNQMFQLACAYALALRRRVNVGISLDRINSTQGDHFTARSFELDKAFNLQEITIIKPDDFKFIDNPGRSIYLRIKRKIKRGKCLYEKGIQYHPEIDLLSSEVYLEGYFQSYRYFDGCFQEIRKLFQFNAPSITTQNFIEETQYLKKVAVHVRRGDYVSTHNLSIHGLCGPDYYQQAAAIFKKDEVGAFVVVSDDPIWARKNITFDCKTYYLDWNHGSDSWEDMLIISLCDHAIISNSSFSWWGAMLIEEPSKKIVAPARWYADNFLQNQTNDLIPSSWIRI